MKLYDACKASSNNRAYCDFAPNLRYRVELRDGSIFGIDVDGAASRWAMTHEQVAALNATGIEWTPCIPMQLSSTSLNAMRDKVHQLAEEKGWHENFDLIVKGTKFDKDYADTAKVMHVAGCLANIHGEVSEALECLRTDGMDDISLVDAPANGIKPEGFAIELADVLIRVLDLCGLLEIDIDEAVRVKHEYNKTRPYRHGGKAL